MRAAAETEPDQPQAGTPAPADAAGTLPDSPVQGTEPPGDAAPDPNAATVPGPEAEAPPEPKGTKQWLADKGLDIAELYPMKIPGTDITWEDAKAAAPDLADIGRLKLDIEQQRETVVKQQTEGQQQLQATLQLLVAELGQDVVAAAVQKAPEAAAQNQANQRAELVRWFPDLADPARFAEAESQLQSVAQRYGHDLVGVARSWLRLHRLESYLDTLREPAQPPKQVRTAAKKAKPKPRGSTKAAQRGLSPQMTEFMQGMRDAARSE